MAMAKIMLNIIGESENIMAQQNEENQSIVAKASK
jgi:hypothetical protein